MPYRGHIEHGSVVLDEPLSEPDGTVVVVDVMPKRPLPRVSDQIPAALPKPDPFWGLLAGEEDLVDLVVEDAMKDRTERGLRDADA